MIKEIMSKLARSHQPDRRQPSAGSHKLQFKQKKRRPHSCQRGRHSFRFAKNLRVRRWAASRSESRIKSNEKNWKVELMHEREVVSGRRGIVPASWQCISRFRGGQARDPYFDLYFSRFLI